MSEFITPDVNIPQRNLSQELDAIYGANIKYAEPYYNLESTYGPRYNRLAIRNAGESTLGFDENGAHVPGSLELNRAATSYQREGDLADVESMSGRTTEAYLNANPWLRRSLNLLGDRENDSPILQRLNADALAGLAAGGALTANELRATDQDTLGVYAERGLLNGNQSMGAQLLNRDAARRARIASEQQLATGVQGLNQAQNDFVGRGTQIFSNALPDQWAAILNRTSGAGGNAGATPIGQNTRIFDPFNAYAQDLFSSNQSAAATQAVAQAQAQANTRSSIATIAGGFIGSDIRLKEKIREIGEVWIPLKPTGWAKIPTYQFEYRAGCVPQGLRPVRYEGVMADEIEAYRPDAVTVDRAGFKQVNYAMLGLEFKEAA
jgi:hypothetical protein